MEERVVVEYPSSDKNGRIMLKINCKLIYLFIVYLTTLSQ
jgi:hypothetical protein